MSTDINFPKITGLCIRTKKRKGEGRGKVINFYFFSMCEMILN